MPRFTPITHVPKERRALQGRAIESARRRAEQRPVATEIRVAIHKAHVQHKAIEERLGMFPGQLARYLVCSTVWPQPNEFRARVLAAIDALT